MALKNAPFPFFFLNLPIRSENENRLPVQPSVEPVRPSVDFRHLMVLSEGFTPHEKNKVQILFCLSFLAWLVLAR
jgi:hypothetical protein